MERRRSPRTLARGQRVWLAQPGERWALLQDASHDGLRIIAGPLAVGKTLVVRRELGNGLGEARMATVVHCDGHRAGLRFLLDRHSATVGPHDRRAAVRIATHGLTAWISGTVKTPAVVRDVSATGARIEPVLPLLPTQCVRAELLFGDTLVCERRARVVRCQGDQVGLRFVDFETETA
jgi:PilZ domain-containing protein